MIQPIHELVEEIRCADIRKVLLIEDDLHTRELLRILVRGYHCEMDVAQCGQEGLEKALATDYSLILADYMMPGMSGVDVFRELSKVRPPGSIPLVFLSAYVDRDIVDEAAKIGFTAWIRKPQDLSREFMETMFRTFGITKRKTP